ncbi:NlpC/P60 family protein [Streptomyces sp. NPDC101151]|uniref:C40 family peptidase n=1 Tax=Streptomyces sp. NPDC101151 TaxID=3366115 RepID=UPI0038070916
MAPESRDEVRQRIDSLYEQAENATGNYNATRAMSVATRTRGVPLAKRSGRGSDPALDAVARQWFDGARAQLGPTVPAVLPADRQPVRPAPARSLDRADGGARQPMDAGLPELAPGPAGRSAQRAVAELTAGPSADPGGRPRPALEAGGAGLPAARPAELPGRPLELPGTGSSEPTAWGTADTPSRGLPEISGRGTTELLAGDAPRTGGAGAADSLGRGLGLGLPEPAGLGPAETAVLPAAALPAVQAAPVQQPRELPFSAAAPRHPSPADSKSNNRRKLGTAQDLLSRYTARFAAPAPYAQRAWDTGTGQLGPEQPSAHTGTGQWQQPQWTTSEVMAAPNAATPISAAPLTTDTGSFVQPFSDPLTDTGSYAQPLTNPLTDTGSYAQPLTNPLTDTGSLPLPPPSPTPRSPRAVRAGKAIAFARAQIGKPCVWGATGPDSYDCSSLTQAAWKAAGVTLPRAAHQQALAGSPVTLAGLEPGDLVLFFGDDRHVGLHIGDGMMVHAPGPGSYIREESIYGAGESAIHRVIRPA